MNNVIPINHNLRLRSEFERCWPWLAAALAHSGNTHSKEDLWHLIERGDAQLFPLPHGVYVTVQRSYPSGLRECHYWLVGGNLGELLAVEPLTLQWAKSLGCQRATMRGRKGWARVFPDWTDAGIFLVKELS